MVVEMTKSQSDYIPSPAQVWIENHVCVPREFTPAFLKWYEEHYGRKTADSNREGQ